MGIGWIDTIYNNSSSDWTLQSYDDRNNGLITPVTGGAGSDFNLDGTAKCTLKAKTQYRASWCGIPWYFEGRHYKVLKAKDDQGVRFYTTEVDDRNWIMFQYINTGQVIGKQMVPKGEDFRCELTLLDSVPDRSTGEVMPGRVQPGNHMAFSLTVVNQTKYSGEKLLRFVYDETGKWVETASQIIPIFL